MTSPQILELAETGRASDLMRDLRVRSLYSPYYLTKVVLGYKQLVDYLHFEDSELFIKRLLEGHRTQCIEWPRGFFKTTTFTIGTAIWFVCPVSEEDTQYALDQLGINEQEWFARAGLHDQDVTQLMAFETIDNAKKKVGEIKWHFEENELFRTLFPEIAYQGSETPWNNECIKIRRSGYGQRVLEGTFEAIGVGGALQSRHYKVVWEDDLVGKKATESVTEMEKTIRWHELLHGAFEDAARQTRFVVANRWGYADLNGHLRSNDPDFVFYTRSAYELDTETGQEKPIFPVDGLGKPRYSMTALLDIKSKMSEYDFACQYLNKPRSPGEKEVDLGKLHKYTVEQDGCMVCSCGARYYVSQLFRYILYDPYNAKGVRSSSRPAVVAVGCAPNKHVFLLEYYIGKGDYSKVFDTIIRYNNVWRPRLLAYEDVGHQNMAAFHLKEKERTQEFQDAKNRRLPRIEGVPTGGVDKFVRIRDSLFPVIERGQFACRSIHVAFLEQCETFPHPVPDGDYDLLDALEDGARIWRFPLTDDELLVGEAEVPQGFGMPYSHLEVRA